MRRDPPFTRAMAARVAAASFQKRQATIRRLFAEARRSGADPPTAEAIASLLAMPLDRVRRHLANLPRNPAP
jgi:hypothetical protein